MNQLHIEPRKILLQLLHHAPLLLSGLVLSLFLCQCVPPSDEDKNPKQGSVNIDLRNKQIQQLYDLRDARKVDSLLHYLDNPNATLRYIATLAFASIKDTNAVPAVIGRLQDPVEDVRIAAAFVLGQIGALKSEKALIAAFISNDSLSQHQRFNATVLEAIGRCGGAASLKQIASVSTYLPTDTLLLEGQCRAIYRFGVRNLTDPVATAQMVTYVANERIPAPARLMAAQYLARTKDLSPDSLQSVLLAAALVRSVQNPDIRMALAKALGKSKTTPAFAILSKVIHTEQDWRVKCNIVQAMAGFQFDTVRSMVLPLVLDTNVHVSRTAAEFFVSNGHIEDSDYYWRYAREHAAQIPMLAQIALYRASNKWLGRSAPESKDFVNYRLREMFLGSKNPYERAACLNALSEFGWQYRWIHEKGFTDSHPAVKSAAAEALLTILQRPDFYAFFGESARTASREMYYYMREMIASGDPGMIASGADGLRVPALNYRTLRDSVRIEDFRTALGKLKMPRDVEAYMALDKAIAYFEERPEPSKPAIPFNHPIDWQRLNLVSQKTEATIETNKGNIVVEFYPQWAPGSVANFLDLAGRGEYNGKSFHRVVPNFVIQGGCPRGDGYGALDYTIRTEIGMAWYNADGYLGMASAGFDTEGTQFFITHSPAPHLDGNYTIFGKVKQGMDVVNRIQPGDLINRVEIKYQ
jgi:cyclophilin family peptidyl-prolyl cis-trans isomerase/HEAT repeat protein